MKTPHFLNRRGCFAAYFRIEEYGGCRTFCLWAICRIRIDGCIGFNDLPAVKFERPFDFFFIALMHCVLRCLALIQCLITFITLLGFLLIWKECWHISFLCKRSKLTVFATYENVNEIWNKMRLWKGKLWI